MTHPLDNPVLAALTGGQASFAVRSGNAVSYRPDVSPFCALPDQPSAADWADAARLAPPGGHLLFIGPFAVPPADWTVIGSRVGVQLVAADLDAAPDAEAVPLTSADAPEMLALTERTKPGPFLLRTVELGGYLGLRREGRLVAMAGVRIRPPGFAEISAVCTDEAWRGHGFAARLTRAVAAGLAARGETPFLHAAADNTNAIRLYKALGFTHRRDVAFTAAMPPA
ncbi:MAG TPA: GNAT family N-acetyltransferase [Trebonia sp.]|nr:GNAT family N-acetyltransferase [Trebonia sp.]